MNSFTAFIVMLAVALVCVTGGVAGQQPSHPIGGKKPGERCLGSAGYSWCEPKNKCLRVWEEKCE